jgi:hypothetical protein
MERAPPKQGFAWIDDFRVAPQTNTLARVIQCICAHLHPIWRRHQLVLRMVHHEARTSTISAWTGLSEHRVRTMVQQHARAHAEWTPTRHRGQPPRQLAYFFRTLRVATHAAVLGGLCEMLQVVPATAVGVSPRSFRSVARGERLCQAFEIYCATVESTVIHEAFPRYPARLIESQQPAVGHDHVHRNELVTLGDRHGGG